MGYPPCNFSSGRKTSSELAKGITDKTALEGLQKSYSIENKRGDEDLATEGMGDVLRRRGSTAPCTICHLKRQVCGKTRGLLKARSWRGDGGG